MTLPLNFIRRIRRLPGKTRARREEEEAQKGDLPRSKLSKCPMFGRLVQVSLLLCPTKK